jgi:hypothetical protein
VRVRGPCRNSALIPFASKIFPPSTKAAGGTAAEISLDLHQQVRSYLLEQIDGLDLDAMLLTKRLASTRKTILAREHH